MRSSSDAACTTVPDEPWRSPPLPCDDPIPHPVTRATNTWILRTLYIAILRASSHADLHPHLRALDPFPSSPAFGVFHERRARLRGACSLPQALALVEAGLAECVATAGVAGGASPALLASLTHLQATLDERRAELVSTRPPPVAARLTALLHGFCTAPAVDETLRAAAAGGLARLAAVRDSPAHLLAHPPAFDFFAICGPVDAATADGPALARAAVASAQQHLLRLLVGYVCDADVAVALLASRTLKQLLATPAGREAYAALREAAEGAEGERADRVCDLLQPFLPHGRRGAGWRVWDDDPEASAETRGVEAPEVWDPEGQSHAAWVCGVTHALLSSALVNDRSLTLCAGLCRHKASLAEFLFPLALLHVAVLRDDGAGERDRLRDVLSGHIARHVLTPHNANTQSMRLLVHALAVLKTCHVANLRVHGFAAAPRSPGVPPEAYDCWLKVDYVTVAQCAVRCAAVLAAFLARL